MRLCKKNKLLVPVAFAGLVLLPLLLLFGLQTTQYLLKVSAAERLEHKGQQILVLQKDSVRWEKWGRELTVNGRYFDVSRMEQRGNLLVLTGHYDDVETAVFHLLQKAVKHTPQSGVMSRLLLLLQCMVALPLLHFFLPPLAGLIIHKKLQTVLYKNPFLDRALLPPWLF